MMPGGKPPVTVVNPQCCSQSFAAEMRAGEGGTALQHVRGTDKTQAVRFWVARSQATAVGAERVAAANKAAASDMQYAEFLVG